VRIGVDIDGVLCDHVRGLSKWIAARYGIRVPKEAVTEWDFPFGPSSISRALDEAYRDEKFVLSLPPVQGADGAVNRLRRKHALLALTSRPKYLQGSTAQWLTHHFGSLYHLHVGTDKSLPNIDVLIDDYLGSVTLFAERRGSAILFDQPWNRRGQVFASQPGQYQVVRCRGWKDVLDTIGQWGTLQDESPRKTTSDMAPGSRNTEE